MQKAVFAKTGFVSSQIFLGYGKDIHSKEDDQHWSTAYALILTAEMVIERSLGVLNNVPRDERCHVERCVNWLLENKGVREYSSPPMDSSISKKNLGRHKTCFSKHRLLHSDNSFNSGVGAVFSK